MMILRSTKDIPDEIKNIVELYYIRDEQLARTKAQELRSQKPEFIGLIDHVMHLMANPPDSMYGFYDALIKLNESDSPDDIPFLLDDLMDEQKPAANVPKTADKKNVNFELSDLFDDAVRSPSASTKPNHDESFIPLAFSSIGNDERVAPAHPSGSNTPVKPISAVHTFDKGVPFTQLSSEKPSEKNSLGITDEDIDDFFSEDSFFKKLGNPNPSSTKLPSILSDDNNPPETRNYGLKGRQLSAVPNAPKTINIDLDIEVDLDEVEVDEQLARNILPQVDATCQKTGQFNAIANPAIAELATGRPKDLLSTPVPSSVGTKLKPELSTTTASSSPSILRASQSIPANGENSTSSRVSKLVHGTSEVPKALSVTGLQPVPPETIKVLRTISASERIDSARQTVPKSPAVVPNPDRFTIPPKSSKTLTDDDKLRFPQLTCRMSELSKRHDINPRAGFLLSLIDGATSISDIIDLSMTSEADTMALINELYQQNVIELK